MKYRKISKNNTFTFWIQMFIVAIMNIFLLLRLNEFANNKKRERGKNERT